MTRRELTAFVATGSNLGDRDAHLAGAVAALRRSRGVRVLAVSPLYETEPEGGPPQGRYLNGAVALATTLSAAELLERLHAIEAAAGRRRGPLRDAPRTLDLDLLLYGEEKIDAPGLSVPHPRLHRRVFVLEPLADLAPELVHPVLGLTISELASRLRPTSTVRRYRGVGPTGPVRHHQP
jgi:2-amino-4-hydroxy-6-hydroxymethyldihydropteridine diphosphokinase